MPTYEYRCEACGHEFEKFQSIMAAPIKRCPQCRKNKVKRLISSGAALIFKGSGFYITDYRDAGYKEKVKSESGASTESKSDSTKTEKKPPTEAKPAAESKPATESKHKTKPKDAKK